MPVASNDFVSCIDFAGFKSDARIFLDGNIVKRHAFGILIFKDQAEFFSLSWQLRIEYAAAKFHREFLELSPPTQTLNHLKVKERSVSNIH